MASFSTKVGILRISEFVSIGQFSYWGPIQFQKSLINIRLFFRRSHFIRILNSKELKNLFPVKKQKITFTVIIANPTKLENNPEIRGKGLDAMTFEKLFKSEFKRLVFFALRYTKDY